MAEKQRQNIENFHGSKVLRVQPHLVKGADVVEMTNCDTSSGAVVPLKEDRLVDSSVEKTFTKYNDEFVSTAVEGEYLINNGKLYLTDGQEPRKRYTYLGVEYNEKLGIDKPVGVEATIPFYYGAVHNQSSIDAWFIEPYVISLRGDENDTAATDVDVYQYSEAGVESTATYHFSSAFGTRLFCHVLDSVTIGIFVLGSDTIQWLKYTIADGNISLQGSTIDADAGDSFTCITGPHNSAKGGAWINGEISGSRWDSGWISASGATQLSDGGNAWSDTGNITAADGNNASSGDVDSPETELKSLVANFTLPTPPDGIDNFFVVVRCKYTWGSGQDWRWNTINRLQLYYNGWIGDNFGNSIYRSQSGSFEGDVNSGSWGVSGGITREMITSGNLGFGLNFQSGNNGHWYVDYVEMRVFGLIPEPGDGDDKFEFYVGSTAGLLRCVYNSSTGLSVAETWYDTKKVVGAYWDSDNISLLYTESGGTLPHVALINVPSVNADENILFAPTACEPGPAVVHSKDNDIYVGVDKDLSDSGSGEVVCYDFITGVEVERVEIEATVGGVFPTGMCADDYRVYVSDDYGSYGSVWAYTHETLNPDGAINGVFGGSAYGNCRSFRRCGDFLVAALASTPANTFSGVWIYKANSENIPQTYHYSPARSGLNGVYSYGVTFYNEKDDTESEMFLLVTDAYVVEGFFILNNVPQPEDTQVTHIRVYRVGGALSAYSLIGEEAVGTTSYQDLTPDSEAGDAVGSIGRYGPPGDLRYLTEMYGLFFGVAGTKLYYTTQANPNYWTLFPIELGAAATGCAVSGQGVLAFTATKTKLLSGNDPDNFVLYPVEEAQGCVNGKSIQQSRDGVLWLSTDGLCFSSGGRATVMSKELLGKFSLTGITASALYDEVYYLAHDAGVFIADFRYNNTIRFRDLADTNIDGIGVFDDTLYFHTDDGLYAAFAGEENRKVTWKTGLRAVIDLAMQKFYKHVKLWYVGRPTVAGFVNGVRVLNKVLPETTVMTPIDVDLPHITMGRYIQYRITGDYELYYLEEVGDVNKR